MSTASSCADVDFFRIIDVFQLLHKRISMIEHTVTIRNAAGLHTRPAAMLVKLTSTFRSDIHLIREGFTINAKSIIGVMTLAAEQGAQLQLRIDGKDEKQALQDITAFFESGFGEL